MLKIFVLKNDSPVDTILIEDADADSYCSTLSENMTLYPPVDWICCEALMVRFDLDAIDNALDCINPTNCFVQLISSEFHKDWVHLLGDNFLTLKFFNTDFLYF